MVEQTVNKDTGEVTNTRRSHVVRVVTEDGYLKLYQKAVKGHPFTRHELICFLRMVEVMDYDGTARMTSHDLKALELSKGLWSKGIKILLANRWCIRLSPAYYLMNPHVCAKGNFNVIKHLRNQWIKVQANDYHIAAGDIIKTHPGMRLEGWKPGVYE